MLSVANGDARMKGVGFMPQLGVKSFEKKNLQREEVPIVLCLSSFMATI